MASAASTTRRVIETPSGPAWVDIDIAPGGIAARPAAVRSTTRPDRDGPRRLLVLGHGAGGSIDAADLLAVRAHCLAGGISVARVTQPYRVAGRKAPPAAATLDTAWLAVIAALRTDFAEHEFVYAGRSSGARVACRTAVVNSAVADSADAPVAVVALAFPVHPPGQPAKSRLSELDAVRVPVLVVQGERDPGDHSLKVSAEQVGMAVAGWLATAAVHAKVGP
jgi:predicted alpha/beta-hydrolase family hydrolase